MSNTLGSPRLRVDDAVDRFGPWTAELRRFLRQKQVRATTARLAVLSVLCEGNGDGVSRCRSLFESEEIGDWRADAAPVHRTVPVLYRAVNDAGISLDQATVYRAVTTLENLGLVHGVPIQDQPTHYGLNQPSHHHAVCTGCGSLRPIPARPLAGLISAAGKIAGFAIAVGTLTLHGVCDICQTT